MSEAPEIDERVMAQGLATFDTVIKVHEWLDKPNSTILDGQTITPISVLNTEDGIQKVLVSLRRIEHGVFY